MTQTQLMKKYPNMVESIISTLKHMDVDGETMEYIIGEVGMLDQMTKQLIITCRHDDLEYYLSERYELEQLLVQIDLNTK
jgi:hypothetical protein